MVRTVTLTWDLPTQTKNGNPLDPNELAGVEVYLSAGGSFALAGTVGTADAQTWTFPDLVDGDYVVRLVSMGSGVPDGPNVDTPVQVDSSGPAGVQNVVITFS